MWLKRQMDGGGGGGGLAGIFASAAGAFGFLNPMGWFGGFGGGRAPCRPDLIHPSPRSLRAPRSFRPPPSTPRGSPRAATLNLLREHRRGGAFEPAMCARALAKQ